MKIYTKTGDRGTTSLFGGKRVDKNSKRIDAYGGIDELNSAIGVIIAENPPSKIVATLTRVQMELFVLGSDLATPLEVKVKIPRITKAYTRRLEREIDNMEVVLSKLKNFILPGGSSAGAKLHLARAVCRRAERVVAALAHEEKINQDALVFINRLSDWLYVLARYVNHMEKIKEIPWRGRGR